MLGNNCAETLIVHQPSLQQSIHCSAFVVFSEVAFSHMFPRMPSLIPENFRSSSVGIWKYYVSTSQAETKHLRTWYWTPDRMTWCLGTPRLRSRSFWSFGICGRWKQSMGATPTVVVTNVMKVCFIQITSTLLDSPNLGFATSDGRYQPTVDFDKWGSI